MIDVELFNEILNKFNLPSEYHQFSDEDKVKILNILEEQNEV